MKYKVGDKVVFDEYGKFQECEIINILEKTTRYRVKYPSSWKVGTDCIYLKRESELFLNINECIDSNISELNKRIGYLLKDIDNQNKRRI